MCDCFFAFVSMRMLVCGNTLFKIFYRINVSQMLIFLVTPKNVINLRVKDLR